MGGEPYWYFVKYKPDLDSVLQELRDREFQAGRYNPAMPFLNFPVDPNLPGPGAQHDSIEDALEDSDADGTRSILDIHAIGDTSDFCVAAPLEPAELQALYSTTQPTHRMLEENMDFLDDIDRGHCKYAVVYKDGKPDEVLFAGYSFD